MSADEPDLFSDLVEDRLRQDQPLAARMRPEAVEDIVGQDALLGPGAFLATAIAEDRVPSLILYGPPGCGKTTLARVVARSTAAAFEERSAVSASLADVRGVIAAARDRLAAGTATVLFLDEIHRFNKAQQDALLPSVEDGLITLIGATTENPFYEVNSALISRTRVVVLEPLDASALGALLDRATTDPRGLSGQVQLDGQAREAIVTRAAGDARQALNLLEAAAAASDGTVTVAVVDAASGGQKVVYDRDGDAHYDTISAYIKSMRGSDPDAALYYLAVMLHAGEDPKYIARRIIVAASEDVGNADPQALDVAVACARAVEFVGMPEARISLAQATTYLALAPKSNAAYKGIDAAMSYIRERGAERPPLALRDGSAPNKRHFGHGEGYHYPHEFPHGVLDESLLPDGAKDARFYHPTDRGREGELAGRLERLRESDEKERPF
ncbi:MAG: replication-associated recombination protein A [Thermoleophilia bacterium]|nr:replication-associated recombination protein A [Thermoleophilia bacterium]